MKGLLIPIGLSAVGVIIYFFGTILDMQGAEWSFPTFYGDLDVAISGQVIGLWGLILALTGFIVLFFAVGLLYSLKVIEAGEPAKQEPTNIVDRYLKAKQMDSFVQDIDKEEE